jgi:hypothetical protein
MINESGKTTAYPLKKNNSEAYANTSFTRLNLTSNLTSKQGLKFKIKI